MYNFGLGVLLSAVIFALGIVGNDELQTYDMFKLVLLDLVMFSIGCVFISYSKDE